MGKVKVKVKKVVEKLPKLGGEPILVRFEHGELKPGVELSSQMAGCYFEGNVGSTDASKNLNSKNSKTDTGNQTLKRKQVVVVQNDHMTYLGASDNPLNSDPGELRTFIAIRRRKKMSIYEANPIVVSPYLGGMSHLQVQEKSPSKTAEQKKNAAIDLVKAFGSKKKRLTYERIEKNKIDSQHMNESINTATEAAQVSTEVQDNRDESVLTLVPPCNRETPDYRLVYLLNDILTKSDLDEMDEIAEQWLFCSPLQMQTWRDAKTFSDYFFAMWKHLSPRKDEPQTKHLAKLVLYTELLICLMKLKHYDIRKKIPNLPPEFPQWLVEKALDNFTTVNANNIRCRSDAYKDKTACYIMVLVLFANEFVFDVQLMSTSLQIHIKKLLMLAKAVGITVNYNPTSKEYRGLLKVPLPKPVEKRGRARQMR